MFSQVVKGLDRVNWGKSEMLIFSNSGSAKVYISCLDLILLEPQNVSSSMLSSPFSIFCVSTKLEFRICSKFLSYVGAYPLVL